MPKFRKKPVVIEAEQFIEYDEVSISTLRDFCGDDLIEEGIKLLPRRYKIATLEGISYDISDGDWIIKGVEGEFYPCKPDIFEKTYEPA